MEELKQEEDEFKKDKLGYLLKSKKIKKDFQLLKEQNEDFRITNPQCNIFTLKELSMEEVRQLGIMMSLIQQAMKTKVCDLILYLNFL